MNKKLSYLISLSIDKCILSKNLIILSLASLSHIIKKTHNTDCAEELKKLGLSLAKHALTHCFIEAKELEKLIPLVSTKVFLEETHIVQVCHMSSNKEHQYQEDFIPDSLIFSEFYQKEKLFDYVEKEILKTKLNENMKKSILKLKTKDFTYDVILQCFKWNKKEILDSSQTRYYSTAHRLGYILGIINNKLPETLSRVISQYESENLLLQADFKHLFLPQALYHSRYAESDFDIFRLPIFTYE